MWTRRHVNGWKCTVFQWEPESFSAGASPGTSLAMRDDVRSLASAQAYADDEVPAHGGCAKCEAWRAMKEPGLPLE
jgi:hypothetical protein